MPKDSLKHKAASGMIWTAIQKYSTMIIGFISGIILARLLTAEDYGAIGMLAIFMSLAEVFIDAGFGSALIQKKNPTSADYSTVFYFNIGMSAILYVVIFFTAPLIARFYHMPILGKVLRVQGIILFIYAFNIIQRNQIRKNLRFKKLSTITIITSVISLIVTIVMAYKGFGVWSLVVQNILTALVPCIFFWITTDWHPTWEYSWKSFRELFSFGFYMFLTHLFNTVSSKISGLLIGRWYDPATMGYYSKAASTERMASDSISGIMVQTTYPLYASIQDDKQRMANMVKHITSTLAYITVPILSLLIVIAEPMFVLLYSDRWLPCVPYFRILCFAGMAHCLQAVNNQTIAAIGKSRVMFIWVIIKRSCGIALQVVGLLVWGMKGLMVGLVLASWFSYAVNISLVSKFVGYRSFQQLKDLAPMFIVSAVAAAVSYYLGALIHWSMYPIAIIQVFVFCIVYIGWSVFIKPEAFTYTLSVLASFLFKRGNNE